ncbi:hypothetical protein E4U15_006798 [Claviceps sp. LM218 group G6]|nr:hypothetical protein E4U15_006798 [Claviceps sp. LM218 group G6]
MLAATVTHATTVLDSFCSLQARRGITTMNSEAGYSRPRLSTTTVPSPSPMESGKPAARQGRAVKSIVE